MKFPTSRRRGGFVDLHTHMVPSGDDGVATIEEAFALLSEAAGRETSLLFGTPHVNDDLPLTPERERVVRDKPRRAAQRTRVRPRELQAAEGRLADRGHAQAQPRTMDAAWSCSASRSRASSAIGVCSLPGTRSRQGSRRRS